MITQGVYKDLSNEDYHAAPAISRSGIMMFDESPYKYWANYINPKRPPKKTTDGMIFGSAFHTYILEPHLFHKHYTVAPEKVLLRDVGREEYELYKAEIAKLEMSTKTILTQEDLDTIYRMTEALHAHPQAYDLIKGGRYEESFFWEDKKSGLILKARPDILHHNMIVDLKTCASASTRAFQRSMVDGGYHVQGAMIQEAVRILEGREIETVVNICVEKTYPFSIGIKLISPEALQAGRQKFYSVALDLNRALVDNKWNDYSIEIVDLPGWAQ